MKKILTASLVAMMAVSAANADIASTKYVTDRTGNVAALEIVKDLQDKTLAGAVDKLAADLKTVSGGSFTDGSIAGSAIEDGTITTKQLANDIVTSLNGAVQDVVTGTANGTIKVDNVDVAVKGLGSAAFVETTAFDAAGTAAELDTALKNQLDTEIAKKANSEDVYTKGQVYTKGEADAAFATAAQGTLATSALQKEDIATGTADGTINVDGTDVAVKGLGSAAYEASTAFASAAQGTKADQALPKATYDSFKADYDAFLTTNTNAINAAAEKGQQGIDDAAAAKEIAEAAVPQTTYNAFLTTNTNAINAAAAKGQQGIDDAATAKQVADAAMNWNSIKDASWTAAGCNESGVVCSLVSDGGTIAWQKVVGLK